MPTTLPYRPTLFDSLISPARIKSYQNVFRPTSDVELMGVYLWNSHVCGSFLPVLSACEITLRNAIDGTLRTHLGNFWWKGTSLRYSSYAKNGSAPKDVVQLKDNFSRAAIGVIWEKRKRYRIGKVTPLHQDVIAKTEFSTWEFILSSEFMGPGLIWPGQLGKVFQGKWPVPQAANTLTYVRDLVATVRDFRNRVSHHEPVWKRFGVHTEGDALRHLQEKVATLENLLAIVHPAAVAMLEKNGLLPALRRACSASEIQRFQHIAAAHPVNSLEGLQALAQRCSRENTAIKALIGADQRSVFLIP